MGLGRRVKRNKFLPHRLHTLWAPRLLRLNLFLMEYVCVLRLFSPLLESLTSVFLTWNFLSLTTPPQYLIFQLFTPHRLLLLEFPFSLQSFFLVLGLSFMAFGPQNTLTPCCRNNPKHWTSTSTATFLYCSMAKAPKHLAPSPILCCPQPGIRPNPFLWCYVFWCI